ncbi:hypothetical protein OPV22_023542 [Ensete ventricosum]|uniref:Uncharacterized protein n=1 Tax=Ensete ventricosum TaxID=4639 RepID=A0AAV8QUV8_ENSVE|nr:hypothetical protein OPV22_023542 [Ensete ventricosum]
MNYTLVCCSSSATMLTKAYSSHRPSKPSLHTSRSSVRRTVVRKKILILLCMVPHPIRFPSSLGYPRLRCGAFAPLPVHLPLFLSRDDQTKRKEGTSKISWLLPTCIDDIYDDLISRRVHSSDAKKFAEVCPCPCTGVARGVVWFLE